MIRINRKQILHHQDEKPEGGHHGGDVSAITALWGEDLVLGLLIHYWRSIDSSARVLQYQCKGKGKSGPRLDAWILKTESDRNETLYQTEVKNWCAHSLGEKPLRIEASVDEHTGYATKQWEWIME